MNTRAKQCLLGLALAAGLSACVVEPPRVAVRPVVVKPAPVVVTPVYGYYYGGRHDWR
ncbi:hypothetical protein [Chromobacterium haemolyticum]|uniref:hypothetical protein n=1 Tax=Chromobacterium haemolyticum TaxID=394935 RepID=UPI00307E7269